MYFIAEIAKLTMMNRQHQGRGPLMSRLHAWKAIPTRKNMNIKPTFVTTKFLDLSPGDLFIFQYGKDKCPAIRLFDPVTNGREMMVVLGPTLTPNSEGPELVGELPLSVMSFGKDYTVQLPVRVEDWVIEEQPIDSLATNGKDVYFYLQSPFGGIYIDLKKGELCDAKPKGIFAFTKAWKIGLQDGDTFQEVAKGHVVTQ